MSFTNITEPALTVNNITALADRPALTAAQLKAKFDEAGGDINTFLTALAGEINALISELETGTAAANIGAANVWVEDTSAANIQAKLAALKTYMDELVIAAGAGDMMKSVYDTDNDGKVDSAADADTVDGHSPEEFALEIAGRTAKTTLADGDAFPIADSAASNAQKKTLWSTMKTAMQTALGTVFAPLSHGHGIADLTGVSATSHTHNYTSLSGVAATSHSHAVTDLSGVAKNAAGILITVSNTEPTSPTTNDLWFSDNV